MKNYLSCLIYAFLFTISACTKDGNNETLPGNSSTVKTTIIGRVFDENGNALSNANVIIGSKSATTNIWGIYVIEDAMVAKDRGLITVTKTGFWNQVRTFKPKTNGSSTADLCLFTSTTTHTLNATTGGTVTSNGSSIQFPVDAFEKTDGSSYSGTVSLTVHHLPRNAALFSLKVPGTDFKGISLTNSIENLISYGMIGAKLFDGSGNELRLKNGVTATLSLPVIPEQLTSAPSSIPLWHFNEVTAMWEEEGTAIFNGSNYTGEVSHFSWWNCDAPGGVIVSGRVLDCNLNPLADAYILANGFYGATSDLNGDWNGLIAPLVASNINAQYTDANSGQIYTSGIHAMPAQPLSGSYIVPDFQFNNINCYTVSGTLNDCSGQPSSGTVLLIKNNSLIGYQFTTSGNFNVKIENPGNASIQILAYKGIYSNTLTSNFGTGFNLNVGILPLCDTTNINSNVIMNFISPLLGNIPLSLEVSSCVVNMVSGSYDINIAYTDSASGNSSVFLIRTPLYANGNFPWNGSTSTISGNVYYGGLLYTVQQDGSGGSTTLNQTPAVGGNIVGTFSGPVLLGGAGIPGTLSASFDVYRNN
ncbi:MAG: carboxypeptidase regulatory-like domain-containing protein [Bacteroidetes bacterium]|nr:carboxypeptidase regulatory-like domain-containing protein [Bacteroidota bacterium]